MLAKLKEYKEVISIILFFLGGFFWVQNKFSQVPTKSDLKSEISVLNCLLDKYMTLTQLQMHGRELDRQLQELSTQINAFSDDQSVGGMAISPAMRQELESKKSDYAVKRADLKKNIDEIRKIGDELQRNACQKG